jgi:hypothetical protein
MRAKENDGMADKRSDDVLMIAIESGAGRLESGSEVIFVRGVTKVRAGSEVVKKWPQFFAPVNSTDDEIAAARQPIEDHVIGQTMKADRSYRAQQAQTTPAHIPDERAAEVIREFTIGYATYLVGARYDRDDPLVKANPEYFGTPRQPLVK